MDLSEKVICIIKENVETNIPISPGSHLQNDLSLDSFGAIMIINAIEDEFNLTFTETDFKKLKTVAEVVNLLETKYLVA